MAPDKGRPIADATSEAVEAFFEELPDSPMQSMPGLFRMMPSPMRGGEMNMRSSS